MIEPLRDLFYNGKSVLTYQSFISKAPKNIPPSVVKDFYDNQEIVQTTKKYVAPEKFYKILAFQPVDRVFIDTMFIKRYKVAIVVIIDLFSKYGYAHIYSNTLKDDGITSQKALTALQFFLEDIKKYNYGSVGAIEHDSGSEFKGVFKSFLMAKNINDKVGNPKASKRPMSPVERFNKTLRMYISRYKGVYESRRLSQSIINDIVGEYNNTPHSSILNYTPIQALSDRDVIDKIYLHNVELKQNDKKIRLPNIKIGDSVRVLLKKDTDKFYKTGILWSKEIYNVDDIDKTTNQYLLSNGNKYQYDQLQVIDREKFDKYNYEFKEKIQEDLIDQHRERVKPKNIRISRDIKDVLNQPILEEKRQRKPKIIS